METSLAIFIIVIFYILNVFFNRWIFFKIAENDEDDMEDPFLKLFCMMSLAGTLLLIMTMIVDSSFFKLKK